MWALAIHVGISNGLFWELAIPEIEAVVDLYLEHERAETLRAGTIAAMVYNVTGAKPQMRASDFLPQRRAYMSPEEAAIAMDGWAASINKSPVNWEDALKAKKGADGG